MRTRTLYTSPFSAPWQQITPWPLSARHAIVQGYYSVRTISPWQPLCGCCCSFLAANPSLAFVSSHFIMTNMHMLELVLLMRDSHRVKEEERYHVSVTTYVVGYNFWYTLPRAEKWSESFLWTGRWSKISARHSVSPGSEKTVEL